MYLALAIAKKFRNENIEILPPCIDIEEMIKTFTSTDKITRRTKMIYWSIATQILEDMRNIK